MIKLTLYNRNGYNIQTYVLDAKYADLNLYKYICDNIKEIYNSNKNCFIEFNKQITNNYINIIDSVSENDTYSNKYNTFINIDIYYDYFMYNVYNKFGTLIESKMRIINIIPKRGNCIDDFIKRGLKSNLYSLHSFIDNIDSRVVERTNCKEYHQTDCYEKDFSQLCKIRNILDKMIKNCNKQIEKISEEYTKIE